jgi:hypothetical protein
MAAVVAVSAASTGLRIDGSAAIGERIVDANPKSTAG